MGKTHQAAANHHHSIVINMLIKNKLFPGVFHLKASLMNERTDRVTTSLLELLIAAKNKWVKNHNNLKSQQLKIPKTPNPQYQ